MGLQYFNINFEILFSNAKITLVFPMRLYCVYRLQGSMDRLWITLTFMNTGHLSIYFVSSSIWFILLCSFPVEIFHLFAPLWLDLFVGKVFCGFCTSFWFLQHSIWTWTQDLRHDRQVLCHRAIPWPAELLWPRLFFRCLFSRQLVIHISRAGIYIVWKCPQLIQISSFEFLNVFNLKNYCAFLCAQFVGLFNW